MQQHPRAVSCALVVLGLVVMSCGGGGGGYGSSTPTGAAPPPAGVTAIAITASDGPQSFNPNPASVSVGRMVVWQNRDGVAHHIVQDAEGEPGDPGYGGGGGGSATGGFDGGLTAPGATSTSFSAPTAGVFRYHCTIHPSMVGTLNITP